jgi:hypothetical protein
MAWETLVSDAKSKKQGKDKSDFCFAVMRSEGGSTHSLVGIWYGKGSK